VRNVPIACHRRILVFSANDTKTRGFGGGGLFVFSLHENQMRETMHHSNFVAWQNSPTVQEHLTKAASSFRQGFTLKCHSEVLRQRWRLPQLYQNRIRTTY
jgi:hypothetical protein